MFFKKCPENSLGATTWFHTKDLQINTISTFQKTHRYIVWFIFGVSQATHSLIVDLPDNCSQKKRGDIVFNPIFEKFLLPSPSEF